MDKVKEFKKVISDMAELYEKKNANYGDSFAELFSKLGPVSALVPLWNKLDRVTNIVKGGHNDFESVEDTLKDLACYAVMAYIEFKDRNGHTVIENNSVLNSTPKSLL